MPNSLPSVGELEAWRLDWERELRAKWGLKQEERGPVHPECCSCSSVPLGLGIERASPSPPVLSSMPTRVGGKGSRRRRPKGRQRPRSKVPTHGQVSRRYGKRGHRRLSSEPRGLGSRVVAGSEMPHSHQKPRKAPAESRSSTRALKSIGSTR